MDLQLLRKELREIAEPRRAEISKRYFKTGKGEYGEGDVFLGITVPVSRKIALKFKNLDFTSIERLLRSKIHEERLIALLILVSEFDQTNKLENVGMNEKIYNFYLTNTKYVNNWDLVDLSADKIIGGYLFARQPRISDDARSFRGPAASFPPVSARSIFSGKPSAGSLRAVGSPSSGVTPHILLRLAQSENLWERRIAMIATYAFIKNSKFEEALKIAEILLKDKHDLIHKAVGWMLREVGKRNLKTEIKFLNKHYPKMPRIMLRYAIERFPKRIRLSYLKADRV